MDHPVVYAIFILLGALAIVPGIYFIYILERDFYRDQVLRQGPWDVRPNGAADKPRNR
jgi:hypothetical protein